MRAYQFVIKLQDLMSPQLQRLSSLYGSTVSRMEGSTNRLRSGFARAAQSVDSLKKKLGFGKEAQSVDSLNKRLDGLTKQRNISVNWLERGRLNRQIADTERQLDRMQGRSRGGGMMAGLVRSAMPYVGAAALMGGAVSGFQSYANIDAYKRGLANIEGSQAGADRRFGELRKVAALPGLGLEEAMRGDVRLRAIGFSADQSKNAMMEIGNALALTGGGKFDLDNIITQFGQMASKSSVLTEDLKPIINSSPAIARAIREMFGTINAEDISAKLKGSGKGPMDFIDMLTQKLSTLQRVSSGPKNALENLGDSAKIGAYNVFSALDKHLDITGLIDKIGAGITWLADQMPPIIAKVAPFIKVLFEGLGKLWTATEPLRTLFSYLISVLWGLVAPLLSVGEGGGALGTVFDIVASVVWAASKMLQIAGSILLWLIDSVVVKAIVIVWGLWRAWTFLNIVVAANPFMAIVVGILAVVAGIKYAWDNVDGFRHGILKLWEVAKSVFGSLGNAMSAFVRGDFTGMINALKAGWAEGIKNGDRAIAIDKQQRKLTQMAKAGPKGQAGGGGNGNGGGAGGGQGGAGSGGRSGESATVAGAKSTNVTINIRSLVETMNVSGAGLGQTAANIRAVIVDELLRATDSANSIAGA